MQESNTRRSFLAQAAAGVTAASLSAKSRARAFGANERIRIGVIGCGNQGGSHVRTLAGTSGVELVYVCDVDGDRLAKAAEIAGDATPEKDLRRLLDDPSLDAVTIATPDHWHAPAALLAIDAGKHVYVEKPCAHNVRESRLLLNAARRQKRVVQHGTHSRSSLGIRQAVEQLHSGLIGDVLQARCWNWQRRKDIGRAEPSSPPAGVDYDLWVGPAEWMPFQANRFHYDWHWWFNFGCGGMGNDGIHELDYTLWGLGVDSHPEYVAAAGGKYYFDDDQEFPDTQQVTFEFPAKDGSSPRMLVYEQRLWSTNYPYNVDAGAEFFGTDGRMFLSKRGKVEIWGQRNAPWEGPLPVAPQVSLADNQRNWFDCIRSGGVPNADIEIAHRTATVVHLGNIATRLGRSLRFDPASERVREDDEANAMLGRSYREPSHWAVPQGV